MKVYLATLGCDKNRTDAEHMLYLLTKAGFSITADETDAEVIIVNTCCFIGDALEESIDTVLELAAQKKTGSCKVLLVTGCMAERYAKKIRTELPEVDGIIGTSAFDEIAAVVDRTLRGEPVTLRKPLHILPKPGKERVLSTGGHYAYLKIAEGCDKNCTYCVIPSVRGPYRSVPLPELIEEATALAEGGVRELILVAQETTLYGTDLYGKKTLPKLLSALNDIPELSWIRLLYCYPEEIDDELLYAIRDFKKVLPYLDIPVQHASDEILRRMGRRTDRAALLAKIRRIREILPDVCLRTTVITGFPGETEKDIETLLTFLEEARFDRLGAFSYSREEGTPAYGMPNRVKTAVAKRRAERVMAAQQMITFEKNESFIGKTLPVFIEGYLSDDDVYIGRTYRDAPEVDGYVFIDGMTFSPLSGTVLPVKITGAKDYDLIGEYDESAE